MTQHRPEVHITINLAALAAACDLEVGTPQFNRNVLRLCARLNPARVKREAIKLGLLEEGADCIVEWLET